ncbi:esterase FE4-like [Ostrinia furnacalis]|uniref:esterase FE4-like n=1 Tax=Ostrinia furnacalis TaxID=93504 RepID=UPI001039777C|nr:esterase FE4-like [Ostrinia furnacalis]
MKWTLLLWLYVTLAPASALAEEIQLMPTAAILPSTTPHNAYVGRDDFLNEDRLLPITESAEDNTETPDTEEEIPDTENEIPDTENEIPDTEKEIPDTENEIPDTENEIPDNENEIPDTEIEIPDPEHEIPDTENINPDTENGIPGSSENETPGSSENGTPGSSENGNDESAEKLELDPIETTHGPVRGVRSESVDIISYFDIPYGRFNNSFDAPTTPDSWEKTLENMEHTVRCPQLYGDTFVGDSNCLTLSVFTRENVTDASVLFYIHESNFNTGSGDSAIYIPKDLVNRNVTLVLPNYRLGPLGFLCLRNSTAPGNAALKDLILALEWTKNNIRNFGGDPSNIAISGDGASAALVGYLALSPKTRNFTSKVIADSGSALSHWAIDRNPLDTAENLAELIRNSTSEEISDDLFKNIDVEKLIKSAKNTKFRPCIEEAEEGSFLTVTPWETLSTQKIEISFIIGTANHAGLLEALEHDEDSVSELNEHFTNSLPDDLSFQSTSEMQNVGVTLKEQYFGNDEISLKDTEALSLYYTDASYLGPSLRVARALMNAGASVFLYEFSFVGALNKQLVSMENAPRHGAVRGDIVGYLFPAALGAGTRGEGTDDQEQRIVDMLADLWVSFLQTGQPSAEGVEWKPLSAAEEFLSIGNETSLACGLHPERLDLWTEIYRLHFVDRNAAIPMGLSNCLIAVALILGMNFCVE